MNKAYPSISELDAISRFGINELLESYQSKQITAAKARKVFVHEGDLRIEGNLIVDWEQCLAGIVGMIVTGNVTVTGSLLNTNINSGPFLVVLGNVRAKNLVGGGAEIYIAGDATIDELCIGEYNDGSLTIRGTLKCALLVNDDHCLSVGEHNGPSWDRDIPPNVETLKLSDWLVDEISIEERTEPYRYQTVDVESEIIARIIEGLPVLRANKALQL